MIEYRESFDIENDHGRFHLEAATEEHPNDYGNGTLLRIVPDRGMPMSFDLRYSGACGPGDVAWVARNQIEKRYGVTVPMPDGKGPDDARRRGEGELARRCARPREARGGRRRVLQPG